MCIHQKDFYKMRTTTKALRGSIALCMIVCTCLSAITLSANHSNTYSAIVDDDPNGNVSISMITVGDFPDYGVDIPFNITVDNQGANDIYDVVVTNTIPSGYTFDPSGTDWVATAIPNVYTNTISGPIGANDSELITINLAPIAADSIDWINTVEITEFRDAPGGTICADGDLTDNTAEAAVAIFDLALRKELITTGDLCYGQMLTFRTYVMNQGNTPATDIEITDFVPEGYSFDPTVNMANGWLGVNPVVTLTEQLNSGEETFIDIQLMLTMEMFDEMAWNNYTTITAANDNTGAERGSFDADSQVGTNSAVENSVLPGSIDDNNMNGGGPAIGEDEDDHDPAAPIIYDLALEKIQLTSLPSFSYDEEVTFRNIIYNQGNQTLTNIEIVDYIPCGMMFDSANNPGWSYNTVTRIAHFTMTDPITPATDDFIDLNLTVIQCFEDQSIAWSNFAEIARAEDLSGILIRDIDSVMDSIATNDLGAQNGTSTDDQIDGGGPKANEDEDDHDIKQIEVVDLAIKKRILEEGPFNFGDTITFTNTLFNQGNIVLDSIRLRDYMPSGYSFPADINPTWSMSASGTPEGLIPTMLFPEDSINYDIHLILQPAENDIDFYNFTEIILAQDTTDSFTKNRFDDADSFVGTHNFPNSNEPNVIPGSADDDNIFGDAFRDADGDGIPDGEDSDDNDVAAPIFYDLALTKSLVDPDATIAYGMPLEYTITIDNQGTLVARDITIVDYLPCGLSIDLANNNGWTLDNNTNIASFDVPTSIAPGASLDITVNLTLEECETSDINSFTNTAEISVDNGDDRDSTPDDIPGDDPDEDDIDSQTLAVYDLSLSKEINPAVTNYSVGDPITFTIEVNNQGGETVQNIKVVDYLPCGYSFNQTDNLEWSLNPVTGLLEFVFDELLLPGDQFSTELNLTVQQCTPAEANGYVNGAEIALAEDINGNIVGDTDSTPDEIQGNEVEDEDDYAEAGIAIYDLSLDKSLTDTNTNLAYGALVSYDITVTNEGSIVATDVEVTDYIPCGLRYIASNNSIQWVVDSATGYASYVIPEDIAVGESVTISIVLLLEECLSVNSDSYNNKAEISADNGDDYDSNPDNNPNNDLPNEDDLDEEPLDIYDLSLVKTVQGDASMLAVGDVVIFDIEVTNEGNRTVQNVNVIDYVPCGLSIDGQTNPGWSAIAGSDNINFTISELAVGQTEIIEVSFVIVNCTVTAEDNYINESEISSFEDDNGVIGSDIDSTPDDIPGDPDSEDDSDTEILVLAGNLGGDVWKDLDFDGIQDTNEPPIIGMTVNLFDCEGNFIRSTTTGQTGFYIFTNLPADNYQVQFDLNSLDEPCIFTDPNLGNNDELDSDADTDGFSPCTAVVGGVDNYTIDAGLIEALGIIGDYVFVDANGNGIQDIGDTGISNVTVYLYTANGLLLDSTITDANGFYTFQDVSAGDYYLTFNVLDIYTPTISDTNDDNIDSDVTESNGPNTTDVFTLIAGENNLSIDAGYYECATICGYSWLDLVDDNDLRDPTENGINGMKVTLFKVTNGQVTEIDNVYTGLNPDTPSDDGYFSFCVSPGTYYLEFSLPPLGLVQVLSLSGPTDINSDVNNSNGPGTTSTFNLSNGGEKCDIGAGYTLMSQVGNAVWFDENLNGQRESYEEPIANVVVQAYTLNNELVAETATDENGIYNIDYLQKKDYYLKFIVDNGMAFTQPLAGENDSNDSDVDHSYGPNTTRAFIGAPGSQNKNMDAGLVQAVLPVEWVSISAENKNDHNLIKWSTASEINNQIFLVQRGQSADGPFDTIGKIQPESENSNELNSYTYKDTQLTWTDYYYRIVQVDINDIESKSQIVHVELTKDGYLLYPNPVDNEFRIRGNNLKDHNTVYVRIFNATGSLVFDTHVSPMDNSEITLSIDHLPVGIYSLEMIDNGNSLFSQQLIKK